MNDMKAKMLKLLEACPERERQIALLHCEIKHGTGISPEEMIDGISLGHGGSSKGHVSNKTMYIALNCQERMDRMNAEAANEIAQRLLALEAEQERIRYYASL